MKRIVNNTEHIWVINSQIRDLNLTSHGIYVQKKLFPVTKEYQAELLETENSLTLNIYKLYVTKTDTEIIFSEEMVGSYHYENLKLTVRKNFTEICNVSIEHDDLIVLFVSTIMINKKYVNEWVKFIQKCDSNLEVIEYKMILSLIAKNEDMIIETFLKESCFGALYLTLEYLKNGNEIDSDSISGYIHILREIEKLKPIEGLIYRESNFSVKNIIYFLKLYSKTELEQFIKFIDVFYSLDEGGFGVCITNAFDKLYIVKEFIPESSFNKNVNYILGQIFNQYIEAPTGSGICDALQIWVDYLGMENNDEKYPTNLLSAHDKEVKKNNNQTILIEDVIKFKIAILKAEDYSYQEGDYKVKYPESLYELKNSAQILNNCMFSYRNSIIKGITSVMLLFSKGVLVAAIEIKNKQIVQAKRVRNSPVTSKDIQFIEAWCKEKDLKIRSY